MVSEVVGEILVLSITISAIVAFAHTTISVPKAKFELSVKDAFPKASSGQLFDVIMLSGCVQYKNLKFIIYNSTNGKRVSTTVYNGSSFVGYVYAKINDSDEFFSTGDVIRFEGHIPSGVYEILIVYKNRVVFEGRLRIV